MHRRSGTPRTTPLILLAAAGTLLSACGDDAAGAEPVAAPTATAKTHGDADHESTDDAGDADIDADDAAAADGADAPGVVQVTMADFHYDGLPASVPAGTRLEVSNDSEAELHELVAFRLPDDERRPVQEIVRGDLGALLGGSEPATVLLAAPGGEQIPAVGDGTLSEPGRYLVLCVVPTGADPAEYLEAAATSDGPPQVAGGPPHVVNGMFADLTVTDG